MLHLLSPDTFHSVLRTASGSAFAYDVLIENEQEANQYAYETSGVFPGGFEVMQPELFEETFPGYLDVLNAMRGKIPF